MQLPFLRGKTSLFALLLGCFAVSLTVGLVRGETSLNHYWDLRKSRLILKATVENLSKENRALQSEIQKIRNSSDYARKVLRERYHVTDPGERIEFLAE